MMNRERKPPKFLDVRAGRCGHDVVISVELFLVAVALRGAQVFPALCMFTYRVLSW